MEADFRAHRSFARAKEVTAAWLRPGSGLPTTLSQPAVSPDGRRAIGAAAVCDALQGVLKRDGTSTTRLAIVDLASGELEVLTRGPGSDHSPQWSPDGRLIAYLSDRESHADRLRIADPSTGTDRPTTEPDGFVESVEWSPDGRTILLGVAGFGSDLAGIQGAVAVNDSDDRPSWAPTVEGVAEKEPWRSLWLYELTTEAVRPITPHGLNVWRAVWCGPGRVAAICSDRPDEDAWYGADLRLIDLESGSARVLFRPQDQLGGLAASPSGQTIAVVEAVCSDRDIAAGDVRLVDVASGLVTSPGTLDADVVQPFWRDNAHVLFVALRDADTVLGLLDAQAESSRELWRGRERTISGTIFPEVAPLGSKPEDVLFACESFFEPPTLVALEGGLEREILRFGTDTTDASVAALGTARDFTWEAPDGLEIHGWLLTPPGSGPHPVVMQVHGGPIFYTPPSYVGRSAFAQLALAAGYALFQPNARGSIGRGQAFARQVLGDLGGADTRDHLAALDALEKARIIDPARIGVTGASYGGYMTCWLSTQDQRFAASIPVALTANWVSDRYTSNVPTFCDIFLADRPDNPTGRYFTRSPIHFADRVRTPTLSVCGANDRISNPAQSLEFHHALRLAGIESVLVTYPEEGHGVRSMPAVFDYTARMLTWLCQHMPSDPDCSRC